LIMLSYALVVLGAILDLPEDDAQIRFGFDPTLQAVVKAECDAPEASVTAVWPFNLHHDMNPLGGGDPEVTGFAEMTFELSNVAPTCAGKMPLWEPCVGHQRNAPNYFKCKFTGAAGSIEFPGSPSVEWVLVKNVRTDDIAVTINCTSPPYASVLQATGFEMTHDGSGNWADMEVSILYQPNASISMEFPYKGIHMGNVVRYWNFPGQPPAVPSPPAPPPPPFIPCTDSTCPGNLAITNHETIAGFGHSFYEFDRKKYSMCYSTARGDTRSASQFHTNCDHSGPNLWITRIKYSSTEKIIGGYTRLSWDRTNQYMPSYDTFLFQTSNNEWSRLAGSGTVSTFTGAIYTYNSYGPTWGQGHDWHVSSNMQTGYVNFGHTYKCRTGNYGTNTCRDDFAASYSSWSIQEAEMWVEHQTESTVVSG